MLGKPLTKKQTRIVSLRNEWELTQTAFGELIGKGLRAIQSYEYGVTEVPDSIDRLLDYIEKEREGAKRGA